jgi:hypothetical protein
MKKLLLLVFLALTITVGSQTPYEVFGHKGKVLKTDFEKGGGMIELINTDTNSAVYVLKFDFNNMKFYAYDWNFQELSHGEILPTVNKKWWSRDPKADKFPDKGPYIFVSCNPINRIDPTGEADYYSNNTQWVGNDGDTENRNAYFVTGINSVEEFNNYITGGGSTADIRHDPIPNLFQLMHLRDNLSAAREYYAYIDPSGNIQLINLYGVRLNNNGSERECPPGISWAPTIESIQAVYRNIIETYLIPPLSVIHTHLDCDMDQDVTGFNIAGPDDNDGDRQLAQNPDLGTNSVGGNDLMVINVTFDSHGRKHELKYFNGNNPSVLKVDFNKIEALRLDIITRNPNAWVPPGATQRPQTVTFPPDGNRIIGH